MQYRVETIGAAFSDKGIKALEERLNTRDIEGWKFHSVFSVEKRGCLNRVDGTTYLAVYTKSN